MLSCKKQGIDPFYKTLGVTERSPSSWWKSQLENGTATAQAGGEMGCPAQLCPLPLQVHLHAFFPYKSKNKQTSPRKREKMKTKAGRWADVV